MYVRTQLPYLIKEKVSGPLGISLLRLDPKSKFATTLTKVAFSPSTVQKNVIAKKILPLCSIIGWDYFYKSCLRILITWQKLSIQIKIKMPLKFFAYHLSKKCATPDKFSKITNKSQFQGVLKKLKFLQKVYKFDAYE